MDEKKPCFTASMYVPKTGKLDPAMTDSELIELKKLAKRAPIVDLNGEKMNKDFELKRRIEKIYEDFKTFLDAINFEKASSPFIANTFHLHRTTAYHKLQEAIKDLPQNKRRKYELKFIKRVDEELLTEFAKKLEGPYTLLVAQKHYNLPKNIDLKTVKELEATEELFSLAKEIAQWTLEIELASDAVDRAILYGYFVPKETEDKAKIDVMEALKAQKENSKKVDKLEFFEKVFKSVTIKLVRRLASFLSSKGFSFGTISWLACKGIYLYIVGQALMPWAAIMSAISLPWLCGGYLGSKLLNYVGDKISRHEVITDIQEVKKSIEEHRKDLKEIYESLCKSIISYAEAESEKEMKFFKEVIERKISRLCDPNAESLQKKEPSQLTESRLCLSHIIMRESEDYIICTFKDEDDKTDDIEL